MAKKQECAIDYRRWGIRNCVVLDLPAGIDAVPFFLKEIANKIPSRDSTGKIRLARMGSEVRFCWEKSYDHNHMNAILNGIKQKFPRVRISFEKAVKIHPKKK